VGAPVFSERFRGRARAATEWLRSVVAAETGRAPNLGHNDGANLLPLTAADTLDYRPAVELASAVFERAIPFGTALRWPEQLDWLKVARPSDVMAPSAARLTTEGGLAVLRRGNAVATLRFPRFRFRPAHADALHVDLAVDGTTHLADGGTYSYAASEWLEYFSGARGHNSAQFDDHEQMPRLGRFLWGDWLSVEREPQLVELEDATSVGAAYRDRLGCRHERRIELRDRALRVTDHLSGFVQRAVVRWRLRPGPWSISGRTVSNGADVIRIDTKLEVTIRLTTGWESTRYLERVEIPVLEIESPVAGEIVTSYEWGA
jgi:hypothetical protein